MLLQLQKPNAKEDDGDQHTTNDPVHVYLRRMGSVSLLTRERSRDCETN